jgi:hypothetical protein
MLSEARRAITSFASSAVLVLARLVSLTDGLIERGRRLGGAREAGFVYHHAKRFVVPCVAAAWLFYLTRPASLHPDVVILPAVGLDRANQALEQSQAH